MGEMRWPDEVVERAGPLAWFLDVIEPDVAAFVTALLDCVTILDETTEDYARVMYECEALEARWTKPTGQGQT
jgi:hypothetical protein